MTWSEQFVKEIADAVATRVERHSQFVQPRLMDVGDAALYIGRTEPAMRRLIREGKVRVTRIDTRVQVDRQDLDLLIEASKR